MKTDGCRQRRESLGAYVLGQLPEGERAALEAHLEGCGECRAEAEALGSVAVLMPHADPARFGPAPQPPPELLRRVTTRIEAERRTLRRRRFRVRLGFGSAVGAAAAAAAALAIFVFGGGGGSGPEQHVVFRSLPSGVRIAATLRPRAFGTEVDMYVSGIRSGTLCRVYMRGAGGRDVSAGTFRYRWGGDASAVLSSALDLSRAQALVVRAGNRSFVAPLDSGATDVPYRFDQEEHT